MPLDACIARCWLTGAAAGIVPFIGSKTELDENSINHGTDGLVSLYLGKLPKKMPSPTEISVVKWRKPWKGGMMPPRSKKQCSCLWKGWLGTMLRQEWWSSHHMDFRQARLHVWGVHDISVHSILLYAACSRSLSSQPTLTTIIWCRSS